MSKPKPVTVGAAMIRQHLHSHGSRSHQDFALMLLETGVRKGTVSKIRTILRGVDAGQILVSEIRSISYAYELVKRAERVNPDELGDDLAAAFSMRPDLNVRELAQILIAKGWRK